MIRLVVTTLAFAVTAILPGAIAAERDARFVSSVRGRPCYVCGDPVCGCDTMTLQDRNVQSGYGLCIAPWAKLAYGPKYKSYYVGGSVVPWPWSWRVVPEPRFPWEGTWGRDHAPALAGVQLWWSHGQLDQDGGGQYEPDRRNLPFLLRFGKADSARR